MAIEKGNIEIIKLVLSNPNIEPNMKIIFYYSYFYIIDILNILITLAH